MSIPASIERSLHQQGIAYRLVHDAACAMAPLRASTMVSRQQQAIKVLLGDKRGQQQVLLAADTLLDLSRLNTLLQRDLQRLTPGEQQQLARQHGLDTLDCRNALNPLDRLATLPIFGDIPLVVDERLLQLECVFIKVPGCEYCLALGQPEFRKLVSHGRILNFTVPLTALIEREGDDHQALQQAVRNFTSLRIKQRLEQTLEMPPLPDTAQKIFDLRLNPDAGLSELVKVVEQDASLAAQVVSWAGSPYYAAPHGVGSVRDAVVRVLGFDLVINLALGLSLGRALAIPRECMRDLGDYWRQSVYTAVTMEGLARAIDLQHRPQPGLCYLAGLLHNYGYLILAHVFPPYFRRIQALCDANPHLSHTYIERHVLGITREQISSELMACWQLPNQVVKAIRWQHQPSRQDQQGVYSKLLFLSTQLLRRQGMVKGTLEAIPDALWREVRLSPGQAEAVVQKVQQDEGHWQAIAGSMFSG